jgi:hypothetical protein
MSSVEKACEIINHLGAGSQVIFSWESIMLVALVIFFTVMFAWMIK